MRLNDEEQAMLAGELGEPRRLALQQQLQVGQVFDAEDFVAVTQAHIMCDSESLGESGVSFLEQITDYPSEHYQMRIPTITDPRGMDFCFYKRLKQEDNWAGLEHRTIQALRAMGVMMTDTCINYQTIAPPARGEHLAFGDTGVVIYSNSVLGAYSNFEGGPAALCAGLTGRVPRYGCHLEQQRRGTHLFEIQVQPKTLSDWGALGALVGRQTGSYWTVPVLTGLENCALGSDQLKHFGAALASYGSVPLFHMVGITPEAPTLDAVFDQPLPAAQKITATDLQAFYQSFGRHEDKVDVVVFAAPQLSLLELQQVAGLLKNRRVHVNTSLIIATSPENKSACDRMGLTETIQNSGAMLLQGVCFYQMHAREMGQANGWYRLLTNSAKLVNIIAGYGYKPVLADMDACVEAAVTGKY